jgi:hypothetical protein
MPRSPLRAITIAPRTVDIVYYRSDWWRAKARGEPDLYGTEEDHFKVVAWPVPGSRCEDAEQRPAASLCDTSTKSPIVFHHRAGPREFTSCLRCSSLPTVRVEGHERALDVSALA